MNPIGVVFSAAFLFTGLTFGGMMAYKAIDAHINADVKNIEVVVESKYATDRNRFLGNIIGTRIAVSEKKVDHINMIKPKYFVNFSFENNGRNAITCEVDQLNWSKFVTNSKKNVSIDYYKINKFDACYQIINGW